MKQEVVERSGPMHNPPHPGMALKQMVLGPTQMSVTEFADRLGVDRKTVSRLVNERSAMSAEMALRIGKLLGSSASMWLGMQRDYDLWQASHECGELLAAITPVTPECFAEQHT